MSLKLNERYPGRFDIPSADYPQGSFKNRTTPDARDGSYLEKDWANDKEGFFQSLLDGAGIAPNGQVDKVGSSQCYDALVQTITALGGGSPLATELVAGIIRIATDAEVDAGTSDDSAITPLKLKNKSQGSKTDDTPGKLLQTGAYGMGGGGINLPGGTDLDSITSYGVYKVNTGLNIPPDFDYSTMHVMVGSDIVTQLMISNQKGIIATRALVVGSAGWGPWSIQWGSANLDLNAIFSLPVGVPIPWPTAIPPARCLALNGQPFNTASFPELTTMYPGGVLPDLRGEWIRGWDADRGVDLGRTLLSYQAGMIEAHDHVAAVGAGQNILGGGGVPAPTVGSTGTSLTGGSETRPRNVAFHFICRAY